VVRPVVVCGSSGGGLRWSAVVYGGLRFSDLPHGKYRFSAHI